MKFILIYLLLINLYAVIVMAYDKHKAKKHEWRIPEARLMITAALFGSIGILIGMGLFHHKTRHAKFTIGVPVILLVQVLLVFKFRNLFM